MFWFSAVKSDSEVQMHIYLMSIVGISVGLPKVTKFTTKIIKRTLRNPL